MILSRKQFNVIASDTLLILTTFFWGLTFVVVKDAVSKVDVFLFLTQRFSAAFLLLICSWPLIREKPDLQTAIRGTCLGVLLFSGYSFQTWSLVYTSASNAAFLTGMTVIFVPLLAALMYRNPIGLTTMLSSGMAISGLYFLCSGADVSFNKGDFLGLLCATSFAAHILLTGAFARSCNVYWLTTIQIGIIGVLSAITAILFNTNPWIFHPDITNALIICVLFATVFAYLVQTTVQKFISPASTALIFCMEPVFAALCAYFISGETIGHRGLFGAGLIIAGMLISEFPIYKYLRRVIDFVSR